MNAAYPLAALPCARSAVRHPLAISVVGVARALAACAHLLVAAALRIDAWFAARAKADADSTILLAMSERELRDIGIDPAHVGVQPAAWTRDGSV